jgi:hypothetical protein
VGDAAGLVCAERGHLVKERLQVVDQRRDQLGKQLILRREVVLERGLGDAKTLDDRPQAVWSKPLEANNSSATPLISARVSALSRGIV